MRELLFGFGEKKPESFEPWKERALIIYAWATWLYRFFLFCGIALLVYHAFFKLLGIFLFCVEVSVFVMLPILRELKEWALRILKGKAAPRRGSGAGSGEAGGSGDALHAGSSTGRSD